MARTHTRQTQDAAVALGALVAAGRRARSFTAKDFAERVGVSVPTLRKVESGDPSVALGTYLEAAVLAGVPLFNVDAREMASVADRARTRLALLPDRVRPATSGDPDDDF